MGKKMLGGKNKKANPNKRFDLKYNRPLVNSVPPQICK